MTNGAVWCGQSAWHCCLVGDNLSGADENKTAAYASARATRRPPRESARRSRCQLYFRRPTDTIHPDIIICRTCYVTAPATIASLLNDDEASLACLTGAKTSSERFITNCRARLNAPTVWFRALDQTDDVCLSWMILSTYLWPFNLSHKSIRPYDPLYCLITDQSFSSCWWDARYGNPLCMQESVVGWGQLICWIFENPLARITIERVLNSYLDATGNSVVKIIFSASCYTKFIFQICKIV